MLVYLGLKVPRYVLSNYRYLNQTFPDQEIWLIVDNPKIVSELRGLGIRVWLASPSMADRSSYRQGFWLQTLNRFFALEEFSIQHPIGQILHVEADVILFPNFPLSEFEMLPKNIAYPLSKMNVGVASTVWFRTSADVTQFVDFVRAERVKDYSLIDTTALGLFAIQSAEKVAILRSGLSSLGSYNENAETFILSGDELDLNTKGIFDASTLGIYLCGTDPRNTFGVSKIFSQLEHHSINPKSLNFDLLKSIIYVKYGDEVRPLYSLHNHAKDVRLFMFGKEQYLFDRFMRAQGEPSIKISVSGFLGFINDYSNLAKQKLFRNLKRHTK